MTRTTVRCDEKSDRLTLSDRFHPYPPSRLRVQGGLQDLSEPVRAVRTLPEKVHDADLYQWLDEHDDPGNVAHIICDGCWPYIVGTTGTTLCGLRKPIEGRWGDPHCPGVRCKKCVDVRQARHPRHSKKATR